MGTPDGNLRISINNPYLSAADRSLIATELANYGATTPANSRADPNWDDQHFYLARASTDLQDGEISGSQILTRGVVGLTGDFSIQERKYNWDASLSYGTSRT